MLSLDIVPLTDTQIAQLADVDEDLLQAWLTAFAHPPETVKNPTGWFINGIRTGQPPIKALEHEERKTYALRVENAERWLQNAGLMFDRADEVEDALFGNHGPLRQWHDDEPLRTRLLAQWQALRPQGEQTEREAHDRAQRWKAARAKAGNAAISPSEQPSFARALPGAADDFGAA